MSGQGNRLQEAIQLDDKGFPGGWETVVAKAGLNPFYQRVMKEAKLSDIASALGTVHDKVWESSQRAMIGRELINVFPTTDAMVRFYKQVRGKAYHVGERSIPVVGEKVAKQDINADIEIAYEAEWSQTYLEDANWSVLERDVAEGGYQIGYLETADIIAMYEGITITDAASGALMGCNDGAAFVFADVLKAYFKVWTEEYPPTDLIIAPAEAESLMGEDELINSLYHGTADVIRTGVPIAKIGTVKMLGMDIWCTPFLAAAHKICLSRPYAAALIDRRPVTSTPYEDPKERTFGVAMSERIGLGVLRPAAVGLDT